MKTIEELGRRAVACKHWRWMPGMYAEPLAFRVVWADDDSIGEADQISYLRERVPHIYPDLSDPCTLGGLLALVREAWTKDPDVNQWVNYAVPIFDGLETWRFGCFAGKQKMTVLCHPSTLQIVEAPTEVEILVVALEAAP